MLKVKQRRYNEVCDVHVIYLESGVKQFEVMKTLAEMDLLEGEWNIEAVQMEQVFLELVNAIK